jgi:hypothetical protein
VLSTLAARLSSYATSTASITNSTSADPAANTIGERELVLALALEEEEITSRQKEEKARRAQVNETSHVPPTQLNARVRWQQIANSLPPIREVASVDRLEHSNNSSGKSPQRKYNDIFSNELLPPTKLAGHGASDQIGLLLDLAAIGGCSTNFVGTDVVGPETAAALEKEMLSPSEAVMASIFSSSPLPSRTPQTNFDYPETQANYLASSVIDVATSKRDIFSTVKMERVISDQGLFVEGGIDMDDKDLTGMEESPIISVMSSQSNLDQSTSSNYFGNNSALSEKAGAANGDNGNDPDGPTGYMEASLISQGDDASNIRVKIDDSREEKTAMDAYLLAKESYRLLQRLNGGKNIRYFDAILSIRL